MNVQRKCLAILATIVSLGGASGCCNRPLFNQPAASPYAYNYGPQQVYAQQVMPPQQQMQPVQPVPMMQPVQQVQYQQPYCVPCPQYCVPCE